MRINMGERETPHPSRVGWFTDQQMYEHGYASDEVHTRKEEE